MTYCIACANSKSLAARIFDVLLLLADHFVGILTDQFVSQLPSQVSGKVQPGYNLVQNHNWERSLCLPGQ